ncbi:MAG TPA: hypothetical protein DD405_06705 [Desulfobacteraceae bacterium]|nr:hypothetical protein [Desulfobacteraceae bacterium]
MLLKKNKFFNRIDFKLACQFSFSFLIIIIFVFLFLDYRFRHNILKEIDRMLMDEAFKITELLSKNPDNLRLGIENFTEILGNKKFYKIIFQILNKDGDVISSVPKIKGQPFPFPVPSLSQANKKFIQDTLKTSYKKSPFRVCTFFYKENNDVKYIIQVTTYLRRMEKSVRNFRRNLGVAFILSIIFGSTGGWIFARQNLKHINKINNATKQITASSLEKRLPIRGTKDELDRLADTINMMLSHLEEAFKKNSQFTADAAHELRTPIAAIKCSTEVILSKKHTLEEYQDAFANNLKELDSMTRLVNDLLLLSHKEEREEKSSMKKLNISSLLGELWSAFNILAKQKNIAFNFECPDALLMYGNEVELKRLFVNLIDNAIKFTPDKGNISITAQLKNNNIKIMIEDNGIGISKNDLPYLFDRFYKADKSRTRGSGGFGLGLSICQSIVKAHQGTISIKSRLHKGSKVTLILHKKRGSHLK